MTICRQKKSLLVAEEIKFLGKELRLKAKVLAGILGVDDSTVSRWENGKKQVSFFQFPFTDLSQLESGHS